MLRIFISLPASFLMIALLGAFCGGTVCAQLVSEPVIPKDEIERIERVAKKALSEDRITKIQYEETVKNLYSNPCKGVERALSDEDKALLPEIIASQQGWEKVEVLQKFRLGKWQIIYVENGITDEPYLFFADSPRRSKSLGMWGGAATIFETSVVRNWTISNIPGIPERLAKCFAWHVTLNRD